MNCVYKYKNRTFDSEMALNDYLLATETLKPVLGDLVYQLSEIQSRYAKNLKQAEGIYKDLKDKGIQIDTVKKENLEPDELDDVGSLKYPYISVTDLIHTMPSRYTEQVFPIFDSDNYWKHKFTDYKNGVFNAYELQFIGDLVEQDSSGNIKKITDQETLNKIRERMEGVIENGVRKGGLWQQQAICGNMIHSMAALFYRQRIRENGPFLYKTSRNEIINWFKNNIDKQYKDYISDKIIESSVDRFIQLDKEIRSKWGENAYIRTEQAIVGDIDLTLENGQVTKAIGRIDLLVIGEDGSIGIIDYKCSPKDYTELNSDNNPFKYNSAKILTFKYQLATYRRLLQSMNINPKKMELYVAPLKFEGFRMENDKVSFDSISSLGDKAGDTILQKLSNSDFGDERTNIESNLERMFPKNLYVPAIDDIENIFEDVQETMKRQLPVPEKDTSEKGILDLIKKNGGVRKNSATGEWEYRPRKNSDVGYRHYDGKLSQQEAIVKLKEDLQKNSEYNQNYEIETAKSLRNSYINYYHNNGDNPLDNIQSLAAKSSNKKIQANYLTHKMKKYSNTSIWEPISEDNIDPILDQYGILLFRNKASGLIDIVRISNLYDPTQPVKLRKGNYLLGQFLRDDLAHSSSDSLTMESTAGNIELIETLHVINRLHGMFKSEDSGIGSVSLLCPRQQTGLEPPNEQLLYNFDRLCKLDQDFKNNHFLTNSNKNGEIKMAKYLDIIKQSAREVPMGINSGEGIDVLNKSIKDSVSKLDFNLKDKEQMKDQLLSLDKDLVKAYPYVQENIKEGQIESPESILHKDILYAVAELEGIKMQQQLRPSAQFHMSLKGASGTLVDNPGTLQSHILNQATEQVTVAYQNVRDSIMHFDVELRKRLQKLKDSKSFGWAQQNLTGNQVNRLYINMYDPNSQDFRFLNPWNPNSKLDDAEREFLKYALIKINSTRKNLNLQSLQKDPNLMKDLIEQDDSMLLVPLTKGDFASEIATRGGIINYVEEKIKYIKAIWNPEIRDELKQKIDEKVTGLLGDKKGKNIQDAINKGAQWNSVNRMHSLDLPENIEDRRNKIQLVGGKDYFEHNLETILLKQHSNYKMAEELDKIFPILQALSIHLNLQGAILNDKFVNDLNYLFDYIKVKVHNQPFENRQDASSAIFKDITDEMMKWSSRLALAFNPKQMYQFIDGLWKDITLFIKDYKGGLGGQFTKENLVSAWKFAMQDLGHFGDKLSLQESLNIQYGMNDMDMNVFIDRVKTDNTGLFTHFWDTGFRFASRPDYYNRMTIFVAQMKHDGCFDAHVKKDGDWVYDWKLDKRFDEFAKAKGDINKATDKDKFNKQKSEYIVIARQLVEEGARNQDGTLFEFDLNNPKPLPKAYSNRQSESMKALADRIYGYYAHEKKSMINSTWLGSLFMQMNTFWSAKKNQYAQERSYTQEGYYTDYEEDGHKWYWKLDETGELIPVPDEDTGIPVKVWKGRPQEGILVTCAEIFKAVTGKSEYTEKSGYEGYKELFNNLEPDVAKLYGANLRQLFADLFGIFILGGIIGGSLVNFQKSFAKDHDNKDLKNAIANSTIGLLISMYTQSTDDFNGPKSLLRMQGRGPNWTPFSFSSISNVFENWRRAFGGDQDFYDAIIKTASGTKQTKPFWDYVKLETTGRKIGQKSE